MGKNKEDRSENADKVIKNHIIWSMGAGLIPIPIADFFAVSAIQLDMIRQLCKLYDVDFKETEGKALITSLAGSGLSRLGANAVKFIPGVGSVLGGVTMSILSGASTYALGEVFKKHFETGGTFLDFDTNRFKQYYNEKFEKGKKVASDIQQEQETVSKKAAEPKEESSGSNDDVLKKLKELGKLRDSGVITPEEFEGMKKRLIENF